ncbi:MAG: YlxR family protein [Eubacteriales bacterium]|nr:YlxR family protein [Eubacteriales bacterium]
MAKRDVLRMCVACRSMRDKRDLLRIVRDSKTGEVDFDVSGRRAGRGAYVCCQMDCLEQAKRRRVAENLGGTPSEGLYERLELAIEERLAAERLAERRANPRIHRISLASIKGGAEANDEQTLRRKED